MEKEPNEPKSRRKRVTARDVARHAGVSEAAVSLVLSGKGNITIARATQDRIRKSAEELGHIPSLLGRGFLKGGSRIVGLVVPFTVYEPWLAGFLAFRDQLDRAGYAQLIVTPTVGAMNPNATGEVMRLVTSEQDDVHRMLQYQVDGVIYYSVDPEQGAVAVAELVKHQVPTVLLGNRPNNPGVDFIGIDEAKIGRLAAQHLLSLGISSFAAVEYEITYRAMDLRREGFVSAIKKAGKPCEVIKADENNPTVLAAHMRQLFRPPVGIFAMNDIQAAMVVRTAQELGWRVPEDVAVVGMGDFTFSRYNFITLTSVNRNSDKMGRRAVDMLLERINGYDGPPRKIILTPSLEIRESTNPSAGIHPSKLARPEHSIPLPPL